MMTIIAMNTRKFHNYLMKWEITFDIEEMTTLRQILFSNFFILNAKTIIYLLSIYYGKFIHKTFM